MNGTVLRRAVLFLHALLLLGIPVWLLWPGGLVAVPLLLPLRGLWRGEAYTFAWASLLQVFYAGGLLMAAVEGDPVGTALAGIAALEFCGQLLFVRVRGAEGRAAASTRDR